MDSQEQPRAGEAARVESPPVPPLPADPLSAPLEAPFSASSAEVVSALHEGEAAAATPLGQTPEPWAAGPDPLAQARERLARLRAEQERRRLNRLALLKRVREEIVAWIKTIASAAVYATLIVTFGFQVARVEGLSMAPTLVDQDRLIVNKLIYRLSAPRRGDIVMLYYPVKPEKSFVKRVIAEEGDTVKILDGQVFVNDVPLADNYVPSEYRSHDDWGPEVVPEGYYFVMGDHRNNSSDSRHWRFVPKRYIIGKVQIRWWPIPSAHVF